MKIVLKMLPIKVRMSLAKNKEYQCYSMIEIVQERSLLCAE